MSGSTMPSATWPGWAARALGDSPVAVIIPAADEELRIGRCLLSIVTARSHLYRTTAHVRVQVIVVLDGCQDNTAAQAAAFDDVRQVTVQVRNVSLFH